MEIGLTRVTKVANELNTQLIDIYELKIAAQTSVLYPVP